MTLPIEVRGLTVQFGDVTALDDLSFTLDGGKIYGLLGRNGSGKTTLLSTFASFLPGDHGTVLIDGQEPFENPAVTEQVCLIRESGAVIDSGSVKDAISMAAALRPSWDAPYADHLLDMFGIEVKRTVSKLSRGQRSALGITLGMATRAPLTIFDEAYLGLDAPARYAFYDELLRDYMETPRTFILSSHLIEEVGQLFEEVIILDHGRLVAHDDTETLLARGASVTGPASQVDEFTAGLTVLSKRQLGGTKQTTVYGELDDERLRQAARLGLDLGPVGLQDLFVHLTTDGRGRA